MRFFPMKTLKIKGYRNRLVPNTFYSSENKTNHVAILYPGWEYTNQMPLLFYTRQLLINRGADVLCVDYSYSCNNEFNNSSNIEKKKWITADVISAYKSVICYRHYREITLIGKSLGSLAVVYLLQMGITLEKLKILWITPALSENELQKAIKECKYESLLIIGTEDRFYDPDVLYQIQKNTSTEVLIIQDADHNLGIKGEIIGSIDNLKIVIDALNSFLK